jgi:hypothetical protein
MATYTEEQKRSAVAAYVVKGTLTGASEVTGIPWTTIQTWRARQSEWWQTIEAEVWELHGDELKASYLKTVNSAMEQMVDRVEKGDVSRDKEGNEIRTPVKALDLAKIAGICQDKLSLLQGRPTSISAKSSGNVVADKLEQLRRAARESAARDASESETDFGDAPPPRNGQRAN